jgi:hypothetical protein
MGQFYSVNDARAVPHWSRATLDAVEEAMGAGHAAPSTWAGVPFNPMLQNRQFLLERGDPAPLVPKWGNILRAPDMSFEVEIARSSEVFVLVTCDVETAHMYTAILLSGRWERHTYWRVGSNTELVTGGNVFFQHCEKVQAQRAHEEKLRGMQTPPPGIGKRRGSKNLPGVSYQADMLSAERSRVGSSASQYETPMQLRPENQTGALTEPDQVAVSRILQRSQSDGGPFDGLSTRTRASWGSVFDKNPWARTQWEHFMLYGVKEGVLGHFADNLDACAEAMGQIIASAGGRPTVCLAHRVGTVAMTSDLVATINADLRRSFNVKSEDHLLRQSTNCAVFVMRVLKSLNLPLRGSQLTEAAAQHPKIGRAAGQVLGQAWEYLWNRVDP